MNQPDYKYFPNWFPLLALLLGVLAAAWSCLHREALFGDETIAITHSLQPLPHFFIQVIRNDIHPFFYFLLLKGWSSLAPDSDRWILLSSLFFSLCSLLCIYACTRAAYGKQTALWAAAIFAALPVFASGATNLRMYGLLPGLAVLCWFANRYFLAAPSLRTALLVLLAQWCFAYSHAIGFYFTLFFALAALVEQRPRLTRKRFAGWVLVQLLFVAGAAFLVASALIRGTEPMGAPDFSSLLIYPAELTMPWGTRGSGLYWGGAIFVSLLVLAATHPQGRRLALAVPVAGVCTAVVMGWLLQKSMFKPPVFGASLLPFLAIAAAIAVSQSQSRLLQGLAVAIIAAAMYKNIGYATYTKQTNVLSNVGHYLVEHARPGDSVIIPNVSVFWGVMRYADKAQWGEPLTTMPLQNNDQWQALTNRLGPTLTAALKLQPESDSVMVNGIRYIVGTDATHYELSGGRVWMVFRHSYRETVVTDTPLQVNNSRWFDSLYSVTALNQSADGVNAISNPERPPEYAPAY